MSQYDPDNKEITASGDYAGDYATLVPHPLPPPQQPSDHPPNLYNPQYAPPPPYEKTQQDQDVYQNMLALPLEKQKEIVIKAMLSLSVKDKSEILQQSGIRPLSQDATDFVWKAVISGAVAVFVGSSAAIIVAVFLKADVAPLITIFTAVIAFIGGLLAPSPVQSAIRSLTSSFKSSS